MTLTGLANVGYEALIATRFSSGCETEADRIEQAANPLPLTERMDTSMRTELDHSPYQLIWIASVATALLCAVVTAAFMAWMPTGIHAAPAGAVTGTPARTTCNACGVIEAVREIDTPHAPRSYEVTIRYRDGSKHVFNEATPRTWRAGTRVRVIQGDAGEMRRAPG